MSATLPDVQNLLVTVASGKDDRIRAVITTGDKNRNGLALDVAGIDVGAFLKNPVVLWGHDANDLPVGRVVEVERFEDRIEAVIEFTDTERGREIHSLYRDGFLHAFSIGYVITDAVEQDGALVVTACELVELSCVTVPANREALVKQSFIRRVADAVKNLIFPEQNIGEIMADEVKTDEVKDEVTTDATEEVDSTTEVSNETESQDSTDAPVETEEVAEDEVTDETPDEESEELTALRTQVDALTKQVADLQKIAALAVTGDAAPSFEESVTDPEAELVNARRDQLIKNGTAPGIASYAASLKL